MLVGQQLHYLSQLADHVGKAVLALEALALLFSEEFAFCFWPGCAAHSAWSGVVYQLTVAFEEHRWAARRHPRLVQWHDAAAQGYQY